MVISATTTLRLCEIKGLRLKDINLEKQTITVQGSHTKTNAGVRTNNLNPAGHFAISQLLDRARALGAFAPDHYLLPAYPKSKGESFDVTNHQQGWRSAWRSLRIKAGLPDLRFYDLRHHANTKLLEQGTSDHVVMSIAGWKSGRMPAHYAHIRNNAKKEAIENCLDLPIVYKGLSEKKKTA